MNNNKQRIYTKTTVMSYDSKMRSKRPTLTMLLLATLPIYSIAISSAISISDQSLSTTTTTNATIRKFPQNQALSYDNPTSHDHVIEQTRVKKLASRQQQINRSQSGRNTKQNSRHKSATGKRNDISPKVNYSTKINSSTRIESTTNTAALDRFVLAQQEVRRMMSYNNTPPVFITSTRDFYIDVVRHPVGTKLTTIKALDTDGDDLEYSLKPANVRDASVHFSIDSYTGELKLANKPFTFYPDPIRRSSVDNGGDAGALPVSQVGLTKETEEKANDKTDEDEDDVDNDEDSDVDKDTSNEDQFLDRNLYFLNVAAHDGRQTSVIEFQIHVTNSSFFSLFQSIGVNSPIELTPEGNRKINERLDSIIRKKTGDFYNGLYKVPPTMPTNGSSSTIVYPSFINPGLVNPGYGQSSTMEPDQLDDDSITMSTTITPPDYTTPTEHANTRIINLHPTQASNYRETPNINALYSSIPQVRQPSSNTDAAAIISQPMATSLVLVCSCLMLTLVLLMFIVPISVKKLRKRLKNVELQHEHLSKQNSTGSSMICSSSTTSSMACHSHNPSWQSQFTVDSDNLSSNFRDGPRSVCRQSSLDSAITAANSVVSPSSIMLNQRLFNRVNNGSIANPVYLQNHQSTLPIHREPVEKHCDSIYCPIEHDYSTINPDIEHPSNQLSLTSNDQLMAYKDLNLNFNPNNQFIDCRIESPGSDSGSSIRSLIKFLSLPARHSAHARDTSQVDTDFKFNDDDNHNHEQQVASKTIARASNISREQHDNQNWELERHKLKFLKLLDEGQFGMVWKCKLKQSFHAEITVAVKTLKDCATKDQREREELLAEIEIMKLVCNHPNVVKILHCCTTDAILAQNQPIYLVMEYVELGKLQSYLKKSRVNRHYATNTLYNCGLTSDNEQHLTSRDLVKFIYHVAKGMEYISSQCIVHRDLASRNILVSPQKVCKIGDFGMARRMQSFEGVYERHSRNTKVPVRWMAPEVLLNNKFTTESDVYSFGILMWEIVTLGSTPYIKLETEEVIKEVARDGKRPDKPEYCHLQLFEIMSKCWSQRPEGRPTFKSLVKQLGEMLLSANNYIELDQYPDHTYYNIVDARSELL